MGDERAYAKLVGQGKGVLLVRFCPHALLERYAVEVSHTVQQASDYFILPFAFPASAYLTNH